MNSDLWYYYCPVCKTHFRANGSALPSKQDLDDVLNEHLADLHD